MSTTDSPTRRALVLKDPNAALQQQQPRKALSRTLHAAWPAPARQGTKRSFSPTRSPLTSPRAGQKRKIEELHDTQPLAQTDSQETISAHPLSQITDMLSDTEDIEENAEPSLTRSKSTLNTSFNSFRDSQEDAPHVEPEFHIHEEPSQQTLDTMHAVTFAPSTSQLIPPLRPNLLKETSQLSVSMSSLIDFDDGCSSQGDEMQMIEEPELQQPAVDMQSKEEEARKEMMLEKAETLRTRLQLAFYKIQTNQITSPFARLQKPRTPSPGLQAASSPPRSSSTVRPDHATQPTTISPESRVALARARATSGIGKAVRPLSSLPAPQINPTVFSARWNHGIGTHEQQRNIPSSPPLPRADVLRRGDVQTRGRPGAEPHTPLQLSSPIASQQDIDETSRRAQPRPRTLTSSVVKGEAANSLLELVRGDARSANSGMYGL